MTRASAGGADGRHRGDVLLGGSAIVTGIAGALTLVISQRHLGLDAMAPLAQLWTIWAVLAAGLTFSFQQWAAITPIGLVDVLDGTHRRVLLALMGLALALGTVMTIARESLFHSGSIVWPVAATVLPLGTALTGVTRGVLAREERRITLALAIAGDNVLRLSVTIVLVAIGAQPAWFALPMVSGFAAVGLAARRTAGPSAPASAYGALGASAAAGFVAHALMFGSPILLTIAGGAPTEVASLFLVLTGVRVPFIVLQALVPQLAVRLSSSPDGSVATRTRRNLAIVAGLGAIGAVAAGAALGDVIIGSVFSMRGEVDDATYGLLAGASVLAACALVATVVLVVEHRPRRIVVAWGVAALSGGVTVALGAVDTTASLSVWLLVAHATVVALALAPGRRRAAPVTASVGSST